MKILLLGCHGQVGWQLQRSLAVLGDVIALGSAPGTDDQGLCGDLGNLNALVQTVRAVAPNVIVNAAAYTAVDRAESEPERARAINALAPAVLAAEAQRLGAWLVHYSTDYVFDGSGVAAWREEDICAPLSMYGRSKYEGELAVRTCAKHLLFRTSWVYSARGSNFARTMLRLAAERPTLTVVEDQVGAPTSAELLADVTAHALRAACKAPELAGTYHCVASGFTSWRAYAQYVLAEATDMGAVLQCGAESVLGTSTANYPTAAQRPLNSRMDTQKLQLAFSLHLPQWQIGVRRMLQETIGAPRA
ncbi:MAG: dTDP-4-dehydrorhamnose reductase [Rhodoferax sp.]